MPLQRYDWSMLMAFVTLGFLGWMALLAVQLLLLAQQDTARAAATTTTTTTTLTTTTITSSSSSRRDSPSPAAGAACAVRGESGGENSAGCGRNGSSGTTTTGVWSASRVAGASGLVVVCVLLWRAQSPGTYYLYVLLPCACWSEVLHHWVSDSGLIAGQVMSSR